MKTVLVAYEREQDLAAVETLLSTRGYRVLRARTGVEALDLARREDPGVVLSDVMLPKLDGFALCRRLKEDPALLRIPVLLHSFRVEGPKYEVFAAEVGAERFMPRGSKIEDLVNLIDELQPGSGTMRVPALVPELLEKREQDRKRLVDLERQIGELETTNERLRGAEREALEEADRRIQETRSDAERRIREAAERDGDRRGRRGGAQGAHRGARGSSSKQLAHAQNQGTRRRRGVARGARAREPARDASRRGAGRPHSRAGRRRRRRAPAVGATSADLALRHGDAGAARGERFRRGALRHRAREAAQPQPP